MAVDLYVDLNIPLRSVSHDVMLCCVQQKLRSVYACSRAFRICTLQSDNVIFMIG